MNAESKEPIVFKQRFVTRRHPNVRILNQKHLVYIATRHGFIKNPGCGFGLWGRLPEMKRTRNINDLRTAYRAVGKASAVSYTHLTLPTMSGV